MVYLSSIKRNCFSSKQIELVQFNAEKIASSIELFKGKIHIEGFGNIAMLQVEYVLDIYVEIYINYWYICDYRL